MEKKEEKRRLEEDWRRWCHRHERYDWWTGISFVSWRKTWLLSLLATMLARSVKNSTSLTIEANLCRWDVCSTAVVAAGMNVVSGHCNRACKPLLHTHTLSQTCQLQTVFLWIALSWFLSQSFCILIHISVCSCRGKWSCLATSHTATFLHGFLPLPKIHSLCLSSFLCSPAKHIHNI